MAEIHSTDGWGIPHPANTGGRSPARPPAAPSRLRSPPDGRAAAGDVSQWEEEIVMRFASRLLVLAAAASALASAPAAAQPTATPTACDLATLLDRGKLDSVAARVPGSEDSFVAALYIPGQQLILVSGRYAAPSLLRSSTPAPAASRCTSTGSGSATR
jgi:hypothetical protein